MDGSGALAAIVTAFLPGPPGISGFIIAGESPADGTIAARSIREDFGEVLLGSFCRKATALL